MRAVCGGKLGLTMAEPTPRLECPPLHLLAPFPWDIGVMGGRGPHGIIKGFVEALSATC